MSVTFSSEFPTDGDKNTKYVFLTIAVTIMLPAIHGLLFLWIPWFLRSRRDATSVKYKTYFTFVKYFDTFTRVFRVKILGTAYFFQPSLLVVMAIHLGLTSFFLIAEITNPEPMAKLVIVSMRVGRISIGSVVMILIFACKNTFVSAFSGLTLDKAVFFHKWLGRFMFITATIHTVFAIIYYLEVYNYSMNTKAAQIFGYIALACLAVNVVYFRFIRNLAFDVFLFQHRIVNFIMLFTVLLHNSGNAAAVIIGVVFLALDFIISKGLSILHKRKGPTKGISEFEILDSTTIRVSIPINIRNSDSHRWWWCFVPSYGNWRPGQHIFLNVFNVSWFQYHPFTIASLADSGKIVLVIKVQKGFTRKLKMILQKLMQKKEEEVAIERSRELVSTHTAHTARSSIESDGFVFFGSGNSVNSKEPSELESTNTAQTARSSIESDEFVFFPSENSINSKENSKIECCTPPVPESRDNINSFEAPEIFMLKTEFNGPYGGVFQPLTGFDSVVLISAGSGASFTLPVALDLLKTIRAREEVDDYLYRPASTSINIVMAMKKIANLQWYDHLWEEFLPFLRSERVQLSVNITLEVPDADEVERVNKEGKYETADIEKYIEYSTGSYSNRNRGSLTSAVSAPGSLTGLSITYARPDFSTIIGDAVRQVSSEENSKSFACLGCGPGKFNGEIKKTCDNNRWARGAPGIYCYTESFG